MKKPPKVIKMGHRLIAVEIHPVATDPYLDDALGYTRYETDLIVLRNDLSNGAARATLLHELLHVIIEASRPGQVKPSKEDMEHWFIGLIENPLITVLQDNPDLLTYLMARD